MSLKESQALDLLDVLRDHGGVRAEPVYHAEADYMGADVDRKISEFTSIKAQVKHQAVQVHTCFRLSTSSFQNPF